MIDSKLHIARRKIFANAFSKSFLKTNWEDEVKRKVIIVVKKIKRDALRKEMDILTFFTFIATDIIIHLCFGKSFKTLENEQKTQYIEDLQYIVHVSFIRIEFPILFAIGEFLYIPFLQTSDERILEYGIVAVRNAKSQSYTKSIIFRKALAESKTENAEGSMTDIDIQREASSFLVADTDTIVISLTFLVYNILRDQNLQKQLEDEVDTLRKDFEAKDVEELVMLNAVINEGLRL
ncbi:hypothetical protein OCU04_012661 [Sclerotinia nivalis]|uniref:Cytochrome P450 n=1 Tax=Sclerotinia nivalis TaxID=352851 RepID=A0A9X0DF41_9HELO|nr:hypothetical protein OCU04_012661 [Sclerotinia nivalis]